MSLIYHYIINPKKTLSYWSSVNPSVSAAIVLGLMGVMYMLPHFSFSALFIGGPMVVLVYAFALLLASFSWDFLMQLMGRVSNSLMLFKWMCLTLLPLFLQPALDVLYIPMGFLLCVCVGLQVMTLKILYDVSYKRAGLVYVGPVLVIPTILTILALLAGIWSA